MLLVVARRAARLEARLAALTRGDDGTSLAGVLEAHLEKVHAVSRRQDELDARAAALEERARHSLAGISLVRFNTFEDTGGNQSFALALADQEANGVVLSSLHARNQTRVYAQGRRPRRRGWRALGRGERGAARGHGPRPRALTARR